MRAILLMVLITNLAACVVVPSPRGSGGPAPAKDVVLCHKGKKTMALPAEAARAHIDHGDTYGACR